MKESIKPTVVLRRSSSDKFLNLNRSDDLNEVMKALKKLKK